MTYTFIDRICKQGSRYFIRIPFNVWQECGQTGSIPVQVAIQDLVFECKLIPKGNGSYYIPVASSIHNQINGDDEVSVSFEIIRSLTRINHESPYTRENPIRSINRIEALSYPKAGYCGQLCIAMLTGLRVEDILEITQITAWQCSFSKLLEALDYFGITYDERVTYTRGKEVELPVCCIVNVKEDNLSHFVLYYKGKYYDPACYEAKHIISYLGIKAD